MAYIDRAPLHRVDELPHLGVRVRRHERALPDEEARRRLVDISGGSLSSRFVGLTLSHGWRRSDGRPFAHRRHDRAMHLADELHAGAQLTREHAQRRLHLGDGRLRTTAVLAACRRLGRVPPECDAVGDHTRRGRVGEADA